MDFSFLQPKTFMLLTLAIWEIIWKGLGLWHAARNNGRNWFIAILVINSVGILPIIYLFFFVKKGFGWKIKLEKYFQKLTTSLS